MYIHIAVHFNAFIEQMLSQPTAHHLTKRRRDISHYSSFHRVGSEVLWDQVKYACHCCFLIEAKRRITLQLNLIGVIRKNLAEGLGRKISNINV